MSTTPIKDSLGRTYTQFSIIPKSSMYPSIRLYPMTAPFILLRRACFEVLAPNSTGVNPKYIPALGDQNETKVEFAMPSGFPFPEDGIQQVSIEPLIKYPESLDTSKRFPFFTPGFVGGVKTIPVNIAYWMDVVGSVDVSVGGLSVTLPWLYCWVAWSGDTSVDNRNFGFILRESKDGGRTWTDRWSVRGNWAYQYLLPIQGLSSYVKRGNGLYFYRSSLTNSDLAMFDNRATGESSPFATCITGSNMYDPVYIGNDTVLGTGGGTVGYCGYHRTENVETWHWNPGGGGPGPTANNIYLMPGKLTRKMEYLFWTGAPSVYFTSVPNNHYNPQESYHQEAHTTSWPDEGHPSPSRRRDATIPYPYTFEEASQIFGSKWWYDDFGAPWLPGRHYNQNVIYPGSPSPTDKWGESYWLNDLPYEQNHGVDEYGTSYYYGVKRFVRVDNQPRFAGDAFILDRFVPESYWQSEGPPRKAEGGISYTYRLNCDYWCGDVFILHFDNFWYGPIEYDPDVDYLEFLVLDGDQYYPPFPYGSWQWGAQSGGYFPVWYRGSLPAVPPVAKQIRVRVKKPVAYLSQRWETYSPFYAQEAIRLAAEVEKYGRWPTIQDRFGADVKENTFDLPVTVNCLFSGKFSGKPVARAEKVLQTGLSSVGFGYNDRPEDVEFSSYKPIVRLANGSAVIQKTITTIVGGEQANRIYHYKTANGGETLTDEYELTGGDSFKDSDEVLSHPDYPDMFIIIRYHNNSVVVMHKEQWPPMFHMVVSGAALPAYSNNIWIADDSVFFIEREDNGPLAGQKTIQKTITNKTRIKLETSDNVHEIQSIASVTLQIPPHLIGQVTYTFGGAYWENADIVLVTPLPDLPGVDPQEWTVTIVLTDIAYAERRKLGVVRNILTAQDVRQLQIEYLGYFDCTFKTGAFLGINGNDVSMMEATKPITGVPGMGPY